MTHFHLHRPCELCGKIFPSKSGIDRHMKSHSKTKDFPCQFCPKEYADKQNLLKHLKTVHPEKEEEQISDPLPDFKSLIPSGTWDFFDLPSRTLNTWDTIGQKGGGVGGDQNPCFEKILIQK